jgi:UPF0755 protein
MKSLAYKLTLLISALTTYLLFLMFIPVDNMPPEPFIINEGESIKSITLKLENDNYIRSALIFRLLASFNLKDKNIEYGKYNLDVLKDKSLVGIYRGILSGKAFEPGRRLTIPEGFTTREVAKRVSETFNITEDEFYHAAKGSTGYLYPETYFFSANSTSGEIISRMKREFNKRVGDISRSDLVIASIIEGEGKYYEDMKMISGILHNRIKIGMPLQVDVAPSTYSSKTLPNVPINNPGMTSINALRNPKKSDYYYYITGSDGNFYYAKTFATHKENIRKYLK